MSPRRTIAVALSASAFLGLSMAWARQGPAPRRPLDPAAVSVRLLLGVGEAEPKPWGGKARLDQGEVVAVEGWRFRQGDRVVGADAWEARTRSAPKNAGKKAAAKKKNAAKKAAPDGEGVAPAAGPVAPNGVILTLKAPPDAVLTLETEGGKFDVPLAGLEGNRPRAFLDGRVVAQRVPPSVPLVDGPGQDDYPAAAADKAGNLWVAYVSHAPRGPSESSPLAARPKSFADLVPTGGGDQVRLVRFAGGIPGEPLDVTPPGVDAWRPVVAVEGDGSVLVAWSENRAGDWDLHARRYDPDGSKWGEPTPLTRAAGSDTDPALAVGPDGRAWLAWQAWRAGQADILLARVDDLAGRGDRAPVTNLSDDPANDWSPSLAVDAGGRVVAAFDSYRGGNHDVLLRAVAADGKLGPIVPVARSPRFEARPSLALDPRGRAWVAFEERTAGWGKDAANLVDGEGSSLYRASRVVVRVVDGDRVLEAPDPVANIQAPLQLLNSYPRIVAEPSGRVWLTFRHRLEPRGSGVGGTWIGQVTTLDGGSWSPLQILPRSDGMLDNRPALVAAANGPARVVYDGDGRLSPEGDRVDHDLSVAALVPPPGPAREPSLAEIPPALGAGPNPVHPNELADIARIRDYRVQAAGKTYQLLRGEFHRHTEISFDGANDGSLEDMWRYALDCARLDWMGNGDHDNGGGKEYTWWQIQKTTDLYHAEPVFTPMFTYERSVAYPHGHRNVMFDRRGVRTLPRLNPGGGVADDDTRMLYDYLKEQDGLTASHTTGTSTMGTDWRDNDPAVEPIVEIFQGHRNSYEHLGAPRVARRPGEAPGGFQPYGMIWNALALQYRLGFQASSDHVSTHISYAVAIAEGRSRKSILDAFKKRHCYAATDNILLDVRVGDHLMGDEFDADGPLRMKVHVRGTRPIARVDIIKDFVYAFSTAPGKEEVDFEWLDEERRGPGLSWYYVRAIQDDGELAWGSPFWVRTRPAGN